jgi:hypothetical protein
MFSVKIDDSQVKKFMEESPRRAAWAMKEALTMTGGHLRKQMREHIERGGTGWKPLSSKTKKQKRDAGYTGKQASQPLYFMGRMARFKYIKSKAAGQRVEVGFFPVASKKVGGTVGQQRKGWKRSFGMTHEKFFKLHEYGGKMRVKKKTRGAFGRYGHPLKKSTTTLDIPARPMLGPVWRKNKTRIGPYLIERFFQRFFSKDFSKLKIGM